MKPYPDQGIQENQAIFNYRLSRARRVIENAFGILAAPWWAFLQPIQTTVDNAEIVVEATICLHNFLRQTKSDGYCPTGFVDSWNKKGEIKEGEWRSLVAESQSSTAWKVSAFGVILARIFPTLSHKLREKWGPIFHPLDNLDQPSRLLESQKFKVI